MGSKWYENRKEKVNLAFFLNENFLLTMKKELRESGFGGAKRKISSADIREDEGAQGPQKKTKNDEGKKKNHSKGKNKR